MKLKLYVATIPFCDSRCIDPFNETITSLRKASFSETILVFIFGRRAAAYEITESGNEVYHSWGKYYNGTFYQEGPSILDRF